MVYNPELHHRRSIRLQDARICVMNPGTHRGVPLL